MIDTNELRRLAQAALIGPDGVSMCWLKLLKDFQEEANPSEVLEILDRLEVTEKEVESLRQGVAFRDDVVAALAVERDALRAKVERMEQQEQARLVTPTAYRWRYRGAIKWQYGELTEEGARLAKEHNHEVRPLYDLPGAQAQPAPSISPAALRPVIQWLRNGCDPAKAAEELEMLAEAQEAGQERSAQPAPSVPEGWLSVPERLVDMFCGAADNLGDMPISEAWAERWSNEASDLLEKHNYFSEHAAPKPEAKP